MKVKNRKPGGLRHYCEAKYCNNNRGKDPGKSFFSFPKEQPRCKQWLINAKRQDLLKHEVKNLNKNLVLCMDHFEDRMFRNSEKNRLLPTAVPTVFRIPNRLREIRINRKKSATSADVTVVKTKKCPPDASTSNNINQPVRKTVKEKTGNCTSDASTRNPPVMQEQLVNRPQLPNLKLTEPNRQAQELKQTAVKKYTRLCSAINCNNRRRGGRHISLFMFPKDPARNKKWLMNMRRADLMNKTVDYLNRNCALCIDHFEDSMFMNVKERNSLVWDAVPTIFNFENPPPSSRKVLLNENVENELETRTPITIGNPALPSPVTAQAQCGLPAKTFKVTIPVTTSETTSAKTVLPPPVSAQTRNDLPLTSYKAPVTTSTTLIGPKQVLPSLVSVQTQCGLPMEMLKVHINTKEEQSANKIKELRKFLRHRYKRIRYLEKKVETLKKQCAGKIPRAITKEDITGELSKYLSGVALAFVLEQFNSNRANGMRYSMETKLLYSSVYSQSPKAYNLLKEHFNLPSKSTLSSLIKSIRSEDEVIKNADCQKSDSVNYDELITKVDVNFDKIPSDLSIVESSYSEVVS